MRLRDVILRDERANQPAATAVDVGTLFCVTDEGFTLERSNGTTWDAYAPAGPGVVETGVLIVHFGNIEVDMGVNVYCPFEFTFTKWTLGADVSGSITIGVWNDTHANFPPTIADSITAGNHPALSSAQKAQDADLSDWASTTIAAGTWLRFSVTAVTTITQATLVLEIEKA